MKIKLEITLNGFHGYETHTVIADAVPHHNPYPEILFSEEKGEYSADEPGYYITVSESAAKKFGCCISDCRCGEGIGFTAANVAKYGTDPLWISIEDFTNRSVEVKGNYPQ